MAIDLNAFIGRSIQGKSLQLNSLNLVVADLFLHLHLLLVAMLLQLLRTALLGSVLALAAMCLISIKSARTYIDKSHLGADRLDSLLLDLVAKFTANNLAVRSVGEPVKNRNRCLVVQRFKCGSARYYLLLRLLGLSSALHFAHL